MNWITGHIIWWTLTGEVESLIMLIDLTPKKLFYLFDLVCVSCIIGTVGCICFRQHFTPRIFPRATFISLFLRLQMRGIRLGGNTEYNTDLKRVCDDADL